MFLIEKYSDGSASYAFEAGDKAVLTKDLPIRDLWGNVIRCYKAGDVVTVTGRKFDYFKNMIPQSIEFYRINDELLEHVLCGLKPFDLSNVKERPNEYVVAWKEKTFKEYGCIKYSWVVARSEEEAKKICFNAKHFTEDRMTKVKIEQVFLKENWHLPKNQGWISIHPLK